MKKILTVLVLLASSMFAQNYVGVENCGMGCHAGTLRTFPGFTSWQSTLHSQINLPPAVDNMKGDFTQTVSMGAAYGNATVTFRVAAGE